MKNKNLMLYKNLGFHIAYIQNNVIDTVRLNYQYVIWPSSNFKCLEFFF